ncbi:hypothetical protein ABH899_004524 [Paenibacillus sp. RC84]
MLSSQLFTLISRDCSPIASICWGIDMHNEKEGQATPLFYISLPFPTPRSKMAEAMRNSSGLRPSSGLTVFCQLSNFRH